MELDCEETNPSEVISTPVKCNPQEDSSLDKVRIPEDDLPPWSQLEKMKRKANELDMEMQSVSEPKPIITVISGNKVMTQEVAMTDSDKKNEVIVCEESSIVEDDCPTPTRKKSEYTSFTKTPFRYVSKIPPEKETVENFNQFLEISSMTTNSVDHAAVMNTLPKSNANHSAKSIWPLRPTDAPSGILLVFDRMLDCIDPKERRHCVEDGYETDQSSNWSVNRSFLLAEDLSITGSIATDESSLFRLRNATLQGDWLDNTLDCVFPCYKEEVVVQELPKPPKRPTPKELAEALEACRRRKWKSQELMEDDGNDIDITDNQVDAKEQTVENTEEDGDPFDFPVPDFPDHAWKKPDMDNASGSSLSELFEGLVYGTPSDEKDERELQGFLDRTSVTEETSTLSYSDGTY